MSESDMRGRHWVLAGQTGVVSRDGLTYLAALPGGPILVLNEVSSVILECALDADASEVVANVAAAYLVSEDEVRTAVTECLKDLEHHGLVFLAG